MNVRLRNGSIVFVLTVLLLFTGSAQSSRAAVSWYVSPEGSDGSSCLSPGSPCATINAAIAKATAGDTVYVAIGRYTSSDFQVVNIVKDITLSGGWNDSFSSQVGHSSIDGRASSSGMAVIPGNTATIDRFVIQRGRGRSEYVAGGITVGEGAALTVNNSIIRDSRSIYGTGILVFIGELTLNNTIVTANESLGIHNDRGTVTLNNSTVDHNQAADCAGILNSGSMTLNNSTISSNSADGEGGGICNSDFGSLSLNSSTISGNTASDRAGGVFNQGSVYMQNTILAGNTAPTAPDCYGSPESEGYNLIGNTSGCAFTPGTGDLTGVGPALGALIGAPDHSPYHPLMSGSPAIDAGNPAGCMGSSGPLPADQRDAPRVGVCDVGAYEYTVPGSASMTLPYSGSDQITPPDFLFDLPLTASVLDSIGTPLSGITVAFSAPASGASGTFADTTSITTTAITNESGLATTGSFTANEISGSYALTAVADGAVGPALFNLNNGFGNMYVSPTGDDSNSCLEYQNTCLTLFEAYDKAESGKTIYAAQGVYTDTSTEVLLIEKDISLSGGWNSSFDSQTDASIIDGEDERTGIMNYGVATIENFTIQKGSDAGIFNFGTLTMTQVTISDNHSSGNGGGIYNTSNLFIDHCRVQGNSAADGGGIANMGIMIMFNCSVIENRATSFGGGIYSMQGSITSINNSTISMNIAGSRGGGIYDTTEPYSLLLASSTVSGNSANGGGGIYVSNSGEVLMKNTLLAGNTAYESSDMDCGGTITSWGNNLVGDTTGCSFNFNDGDIHDMDARLADELDPSGVHPILRGSPAIDSGYEEGCTDYEGNLLDTDQRGAPRIGRCDIGSFEYDPASDPFHYISLPLLLQRVCPSFVDDFSNPASGWPIEDDGVVRYEYLNGEYRILLREGGWWAAAHPGFQAYDYRLEVDVRNATGTYGIYGLLFGLNEDWSQLYALFIDPEGYYGLMRYDYSSGWTMLAEDYSSSIYHGTAKNHLKIEHIGASIKVYANGTLLKSLTDWSYPGPRWMGVTLASDDSALDVRFDNFSVKTIDCFSTGLNAILERSGPGIDASQDAALREWPVDHSRR